MGSDASGRPVLTVRLVGRGGRTQRRKTHTGRRDRPLDRRHGAEQRRHRTAARAEVATPGVLCRASMVVAVASVSCLVVMVRAGRVVSRPQSECRRIDGDHAMAFLGAQHRSSERAPDGEQRGKQHEQESTEQLHGVWIMPKAWCSACSMPHRPGQGVEHSFGVPHSPPPTRALVSNNHPYPPGDSP